MKLGTKTTRKLKNKKISIEELNDKYFYTKKDGVNVDSILKLLNENVYNLKEIVDKFKNFGELSSLLGSKEFFEELIQNNLLNKKDLRDLLNRIAYDEFNLQSVVCNTPLIKHILNEFVLNKEIADRLNILIENHWWCKRENIHNIFEYIECRNRMMSFFILKNDPEILKLIELNKNVYSFDLNDKQRSKLSEVLKDNEIAKNRLIAIVDNHLESNYDFDSLMNYLKKAERKNLLNI